MKRQIALMLAMLVVSTTVDAQVGGLLRKKAGEVMGGKKTTPAPEPAPTPAPEAPKPEATGSMPATSAPSASGAATPAPAKAPAAKAAVSPLETSELRSPPSWPLPAR